MLELQLLGNPVLTLNGVIVRIKTRKALVLLCVLALETRVSRDFLAALLWADLAEAKNNLRNALSGLRYSLGEALQSNRSDVWLEPTSCDAVEILAGSLEAALRASGVLLANITLPDAPEAEDWLEAARGRVLQAAIRSFENAEPTLEVLTQWCKLEPLSEIAHQRLLRLLSESGQRSRALEVFEGFKNRLLTDLDVRPSPETLALADSLRLSTKAKPARLPSLPNLLLESRLVGRVPEFQRLVAAFHATAQGLPNIMVLSGEPGIGKTRLAQEFLAWAAARDATVLSARAFEGGALSYQCIADALRRLPKLETRLSPVWLAELARILPELLELPNLPAPVSDENLGRSRIFEAVAKLLSQLGQVVWLLDDAQWADAASLEVLLFVLRRAATDGLPVLLLVTVRTETLEQIKPWLSSLARDAALEQLVLSDLSKEETARLLEDLGVEPQTMLEWLFAETGGQPLYIAETLRSLSESGALMAHSTGWTVQLEARPDIAAGVRQVIEARFGRLSSTARLLLEVGAVLGQGFTFADALLVSQIPEPDLLPALEQCLGARVLLELPALGLGMVRYTFSHDKLRETARQRLSAPRLQGLQRLAVERQHGSAAQRAGHALGAREWQKAARFLVNAADEAVQIYAWRDAALHLETARKIMLERPDATPFVLGLSSKELAHLYRLLSQLNSTLNEGEKNAALAQEAFFLAEELGDLRFKAQTLMFVASTHNPLEQGKIKILYEQAALIFSQLSDAEDLFTFDLAQVEFERHYYSPINAIDKILPLLARAKSLGQPHHRETLVALADAYQADGNWQDAALCWQEALDLHGAPISDNAAFYLENLAFSQTNIGQFDVATQNARKAYEIKLQIDDNPTFTGMAAVYLAYALLESGASQEAYTLCQNTFALRHLATARIATEFCFAHATMLLEQAEFQTAVPILQEALERTSELSSSERSYANFLESHLCAAYAGLEDWQTAAQHAKKAFLAREEFGQWRGIHAPRLRHWLEVRALRAVGDKKTANLIIKRLEQHLRKGEPLEVNLALCQARKFELPEVWVLRRRWLNSGIVLF